MRRLTVTLAVVITTTVLLSCTDLTEVVRDTALQQDALEHPNAPEQMLAPVYDRMQDPLGTHNWFNNLQGVSSIEQIVPFRGGTDWFDGGRFIEMHQHSWTPVHTTIIDVWQNLTQGIGRAAIAQQTIAEIGGNEDLIAEVRALKALYNYWLLDLYNVAFDKRPEDVGTPTLSTVYRDGEAVEFIYNELSEVQDQLADASQGETRFNRDAVLALKARLLLNKAVYSDRYASEHSHDPGDLNAVVDYTTQLINGGQFELERENYFYLFGYENQRHPEVIFAFDQEPATGGNARLAYFHASRNRHGSIEFPSQTGSDGGALTQEFYDMWEGERNDPRFFHRFMPDGGTVTDDEFRWNRGVEVGQQYGIVLDEDGPNTWKRDENGDLIIEELWDTARSGGPMIYTREVGIDSDRGHMAGARSLKWDMDKYNPGRVSSINIPVFRLGEMYLSRAEAHARLGNWGAALNDINDLRDARGARQLDASELSTLRDLEREWIFEMYHEHKTRTIQIRFGSFTEGTWRDKSVSDVTRRVFPIPQNAVDAAQGEPGYLEQNPGY